MAVKSFIEQVDEAIELIQNYLGSCKDQEQVEEGAETLDFLFSLRRMGDDRTLPPDRAIFSRKQRLNIYYEKMAGVSAAALAEKNYCSKSTIFRIIKRVKKDLF